MTIQTADTVVHGGTVAFSSNAYEASIAIKGEHIVAVGTADMMPRADNYIDASGKFVLPGAIDCHVHLRPKPGDDWAVGTKAAALAGLTTIIPFGAAGSLVGDATLFKPPTSHPDYVRSVDGPSPVSTRSEGAFCQLAEGLSLWLPYRSI